MSVSASRVTVYTQYSYVPCYCRSLNKSCPRNQQDPTAVLRDESGVIFMGERQDGGQGTDRDDVGLAAFRPLSNLNPID